MEQEEYELFIENMRRFLLPGKEFLRLEQGAYCCDFRQWGEVRCDAAYKLTIGTYEPLWERPGQEVTVIFEGEEYWVQFYGWLEQMTVTGYRYRYYEIYSVTKGEHFDKEYLSYVWKELQKRGAVANDFHSFIKERRKRFKPEITATCGTSDLFVC